MCICSFVCVCGGVEEGGGGAGAMLKTAQSHCTAHTSTHLSALAANSATSCCVALSPCTAITARKQEHTKAAELDSPEPAVLCSVHVHVCVWGRGSFLSPLKGGDRGDMRTLAWLIG
jgi:hypothetical protein